MTHDPERHRGDTVPPGESAAHRPPRLDAESEHALQRLFASLREDPFRHDFFAVLRLIEAARSDLPCLGTAQRPSQEPIRIGQDPSVRFEPSALSSWRERAGVPRIGQSFLGLFGPMGPLPLHLTEYAYERIRHRGDRTFSAFADQFHHRALLLFYRAWRQSRPAVQLDRRGAEWSRWLGSLAGIGGEAFSAQDTLSDQTRRHRMALLGRGARSAEGLVKLVHGHFGIAARLEPWVGHWLQLRPEDFTLLEPPTQPGARNQLGRTAVAGGRVWDRQFRFRLHLGPLSYGEYCRFLPGRPAAQELRDWVRQHVGLAMTCDVVPWLRGRQVPALRLGRGKALRSRLGWTTWLGNPRPHPDRGDLRLSLAGEGRVATRR